MMKNRIFSFFLATALVLYLLHAISPHHHHEQLICFNINHLDANSCTDEEHHHRHDASSSDECCILNVPVVLNDDDKHNLTEICNEDFQKPALDGSLNPDTGFVSEPTLTNIFPYYEDYFPDDRFAIINCGGLRAPPVV